jgi:zinc protease
MKTKFMYALIGAFSLMLPAKAQKALEVTQFTLANGLQVWIHQDDSRPEIFGAMVVNGGAKLDEPHATGMAHYLEHMLFKGTTELGTTDFEKEKIHLDKIDSLYEVLGKTNDKNQRLAIQLAINEQNKLAAEYAVANEMDRLIAAIGGKGVNAFTSHDMVVYYNVFPPHQIEKWMELYSHRFEKPVFRLFQSELETVYEEKNRAMDDFGYKLISDFNKAFYKNHPYGQRDILGEVEHLKNPSLITMYEYYDRYYVPNNMALVLSGDIDIEAAKPIIEAKFADWQYKALPERPVYKEEEFKGKEVIRGRYLPVKAGLIGYRTVPLGHEDEAVLEVIENLLSNGNQTGLWDKLSLDNKLLVAAMMSDTEVDYGKSMLIFVPKIIGQSLKNAERLVMDQLDLLKKGEFTDELLESVKINLSRQYQNRYESNYSKALMMAEAFVTGQSWEDLLAKEQAIQSVSREQIVEKANLYFGKNRLVLYNRTGFPKKTKLDKPPYEPVIPQGKESEYARKFSEMPDPEAKPRFIDMQKDVVVDSSIAFVKIYKVENPLNDIFSFQINYGMGKLADPRILMLSQMLTSAGTAQLERDELKASFGKLGTTYYAYSGDLSFTVNMQGFDQSLEESLSLMGQLLDQPVYNKKGRKAVLSNEKFERKMERKDINEKMDLISEYQRYGENSSYLNRLTLKQIKSLPFEELEEALKQLRQYEMVIYYTGNKPIEEVRQLVENYLINVAPVNPEKRDVRPLRSSDQRDFLFVNDKKSVQTQISFFVNTKEPRNADYNANINAFNEYFGGNMSGLVFQEIREFRSLAYSASAQLYNGSIYGTPAFLRGYVGCQADKTVEAMEVMSALISDMPLKPERMPDIQKSLIQSSAMARPYFRFTASTVHGWKKLGYQEDPNIKLVNSYQQLSFDDVTFAWNNYLKDRSISYAAAGNKKKMDMKALEKFGTVKELKLSEIRVK